MSTVHFDSLRPAASHSIGMRLLPDLVAPKATDQEQVVLSLSRYERCCTKRCHQHSSHFWFEGQLYMHVPSTRRVGVLCRVHACITSTADSQLCLVIPDGPHKAST